MPNVPKRLDASLALKAFLRAHTERPSDVGIVPEESGGDDPNTPYTIIYPMGGGDFAGPPFAFPEADAAFAFQITSVGNRGDQVEWMADTVREVMVGRDSQTRQFVHPLIIPGLVVQSREVMGPPGPMDRDGNVFSVAESYIVRVSTA